MLTLDRRPGESIVLTIDGQNVTITVLEITKKYGPKLAIIAPRSLRVDREEVHREREERRKRGEPVE